MIALVPFTKAHFSTLIAWVTDADVLLQFAGPSFSFPLDKAQLLNSLQEEHRNAFMIQHVAEQRLIGYGEVCEKPHSIHLARLFIADKSMRSKGIGKQLVAQLLNFGFDKTDKMIATLNVLTTNIAAIKCYEAMGFERNEAQIATKIVNNQPWTTMPMQLAKKAWKI